ncbi:MAG: hypothetical protein JW937_07840 [Candidatus Omnitrophica bacterium]|nr:hypothetical protein [Candidatus Omnitrophota bacterium]
MATKEKGVFWFLLLALLIVGIKQGVGLFLGSSHETGDRADRQALRGAQGTEIKAPGPINLSFLKRTTPFSDYNDLIKTDPFRATPVEKPKIVIESEPVVQEKKIVYVFQGLAQVGDSASAIVKEEESGKVYFLLPGKSLGDYRVEAVQEDRVVLKRGDETLVLER